MNPSLEEALERYPRISLTRLPTPLQSLPSLSAKLGLQVLIKRDDLTDLGLGGDKPRKLEYEVARAQEQGADTLVTCGSAQSNHARLTTAAARKVGMQCVVILSRSQYQAFQGNLLTDLFAGLVSSRIRRAHGASPQAHATVIKSHRGTLFFARLSGEQCSQLAGDRF